VTGELVLRPCNYNLLGQPGWGGRRKKVENAIRIGERERVCDYDHHLEDKKVSMSHGSSLSYSTTGEETFPNRDTTRKFRGTCRNERDPGPQPLQQMIGGKDHNQKIEGEKKEVGTLQNL